MDETCHDSVDLQDVSNVSLLKLGNKRVKHSILNHDARAGLDILLIKIISV